MPWTVITRPHYQRATQGYASDLTDDEWRLLAPLIPEPSLQGRSRTTRLRDVLDALLYMASTGCQWRQLPRINHALVMAARETVGREASPTAGVIDSQSVKITEAGGPRGYDAGKKIKGRKRHIVTDTLGGGSQGSACVSRWNAAGGHLVVWLIHPADVEDRDGAVDTPAAIRCLYPWLRHIFADGGYAGDKLRGALAAKGH